MVLDCINHQFLIFAPLLTLCSWVYLGILHLGNALNDDKEESSEQIKG